MSDITKHNKAAMKKESFLLSFSVPIQMLLGGLNDIMKMNTFLRNTISKLYDAFAERL